MPDTRRSNCQSALGLTGIITAIANAIASTLTLDEIALVASLFVQLGDTLATIAAVENLAKTDSEK